MHKEWRQQHQRVIERVRQIAPEVEPVSMGLFDGPLDLDKLGWLSGH